MNKSYFKIAAITAACAGMMLLQPSCGSSEKLMKVSRCQALAEKSPTLRGYGEAYGNRTQSSFVEKQAATYARDKVAAALASKIESYTKLFNEQHTDGEGIDGVGKSGDEIKAIVKQVLENCPVTCTDRVMQPDGKTMRVEVCVELSSGDAVNAVRNSVNKLSNAKKSAIDFAEKKFNEEMKEEMARFEKEQAQ